MPPSLDHALIGRGLIGDTTRGACRRQRRGLHAAGECTSQKGRRTEKDELTHVFSSGRRIFPQRENARHLRWFRNARAATRPADDPRQHAPPL